MYKVDDYKKRKNYHNKIDLIFAQASADGEFWGPLAEKVWAKLHVAYENIVEGSMMSVFSTFTGAPSRQYDIKYEKSTDSLWQKLKKFHTNKYLMGAKCSSSTFKLDSTQDYTISGIYEITKSNGEKVKLLKLRHPHNKYSIFSQYNGPWNDKSDQWTADYKKQVDFSKKDSSRFFIDIVAFKELFESF